jgi:hypothetical protein
VSEVLDIRKYDPESDQYELQEVYAQNKTPLDMGIRN